MRVEKMRKKLRKYKKVCNKLSKLREWTRNGNNSENEQSVRLKILIKQMEQATNEKKLSYC